MGRSALLACVLLIAELAHADPLCDQACSATITFPGGGSIQAVETLQFTFGDAGLVDTAGAVTAYVAGEVLNLLAGETLVFGPGGEFDLGDRGNIDFSSLRIVTDGVMQLAPASDADSLTFPANSTLSMSTDSTLILSGNLTIRGLLDVGDMVVLSPTAGDPVQPGECAAVSNAEGTLTLVNGGVDLNTVTPLVVPSVPTNCIDGAVAADVGLHLSTPIVQLNTPMTSGGQLVLNGQPVILAGPLIVAEVEQVPKTTEEATEANPDVDDGGAGGGSPGVWLIFALTCLLWHRLIVSCVRPSAGLSALE